MSRYEIDRRIVASLVVRLSQLITYNVTYTTLRLTGMQAYYRRAVANSAILKHSDALRDWKFVMKKSPNDKNARLQFELCQKVVKRDAFLKAIEVGDQPSAAEGLDVDAIGIDDSYDGVRLDGNAMTQEFIDDMIERFKSGKKIHKRYVFQILLAVKELVTKEPTMVETEVAEGTKLTVCGDTHGMIIDSQISMVKKKRKGAKYTFLMSRPIL